MIKGKVNIIQVNDAGTGCVCGFCYEIKPKGYLVVDEKNFGVGSVEFFCPNCFEYLYGDTSW